MPCRWKAVEAAGARQAVHTRIINGHGSDFAAIWLPRGS